MDRILASRGLVVAPDSQTRLIQEAAIVTSFLINQSLSRSGKSLASLTANERGLLGILTMVAGDHLSRMAAASFELTTMATFAHLFSAAIGAEGAATLLAQSGANFNQLSSDPRTGHGLNQFGKLVAKFFDTNENVYLEGLAALTRSWLKDNA